MAYEKREWQRVLLAYCKSTEISTRIFEKVAKTYEGALGRSPLRMYSAGTLASSGDAAAIASAETSEN